MRIASFLASATEILCELGLDRDLVAISHECDWPPRVLDRPRLSRPRFDPAGLSSGEVDAAVRRAMLEHGSVYEIDRAALLDARPDLVITQSVCEVCAVPTASVRDIVAIEGLHARVLSLDAHTIAEIFASIEQVAAAAGVPEKATSVLHALRARLDAVQRCVTGEDRPRVLALEWLDPPFAPGHWVPEMIERAGGENLVGEAGAHSRQLDWGDLDGLDPDVLLIMPCGYGVEASVRDADTVADRLQDVAPRALEDGRAYVVDGSSYFNRSGPRVVRGVEILAALLHPARCTIPVEDTARVWRPRTPSLES